MKIKILLLLTVLSLFITGCDFRKVFGRSDEIQLRLSTLYVEWDDQNYTNIDTDTDQVIALSGDIVDDALISVEQDDSGVSYFRFDTEKLETVRYVNSRNFEDPEEFFDRAFMYIGEARTEIIKYSSWEISETVYESDGVLVVVAIQIPLLGLVDAGVIDIQKMSIDRNFFTNEPLNVSFAKSIRFDGHVNTLVGGAEHDEDIGSISLKSVLDSKITNLEVDYFYSEDTQEIDMIIAFDQDVDLSLSANGSLAITDKVFQYEVPIPLEGTGVAAKVLVKPFFKISAELDGSVSTYIKEHSHVEIRLQVEDGIIRNEEGFFKITPLSESEKETKYEVGLDINAKAGVEVYLELLSCLGPYTSAWLYGDFINSWGSEGYQGELKAGIEAAIGVRIKLFRFLNEELEGTGSLELYSYTWPRENNSPPDTSLVSVPPLSSSHNSPTFGFSGTDSESSAAEISFRYYLEGYESEWEHSTTSGSCNYTNLPDGSYTFFVRSVDADNATDDTPASYSFSISSQASETPYILSANPVSGSIVDPDTNFSFTFSEGMDRESVKSAFQMRIGASVYTGTFTWSGNTMTFNPTNSNIPQDTGITISIGTGAQSSSGENMASAYQASFTTSSLDNADPRAVISGSTNGGVIGSALNFSGTGSYDSDSGDAIDPDSYRWVITYPNSTAVNKTGASISFTPNMAGNYEVKLTVDDLNGGSDSESITVTVQDATASGQISRIYMSGTTDPMRDGRIYVEVENTGNVETSYVLNKTSTSDQVYFPVTSKSFTLAAGATTAIPFQVRFNDDASYSIAFDLKTDSGDFCHSDSEPLGASGSPSTLDEVFKRVDLELYDGVPLQVPGTNYTLSFDVFYAAVVKIAVNDGSTTKVTGSLEPGEHDFLFSSSVNVVVEHIDGTDDMAYVQFWYPSSDAYEIPYDRIDVYPGESPAYFIMDCQPGDDPINIKVSEYTSDGEYVDANWESNWTKDDQGSNVYLIEFDVPSSATSSESYEFYLQWNFDSTSKYAQKVEVMVADP
ncbi:MAG: triple tyrosine motif-containing protein [Spirochaetales bacterium]|nr:triple tyrosine motif-containing protein [Spirochaetales bacterium]